MLGGLTSRQAQPYFSVTNWLPEMPMKACAPALTLRSALQLWQASGQPAGSSPVARIRAVAKYSTALQHLLAADGGVMVPMAMTRGLDSADRERGADCLLQSDQRDPAGMSCGRISCAWDLMRRCWRSESSLIPALYGLLYLPPPWAWANTRAALELTGVALARQNMSSKLQASAAGFPQSAAKAVFKSCASCFAAAAGCFQTDARGSGAARGPGLRKAAGIDGCSCQPTRLVLQRAGAKGKGCAVAATKGACSVATLSMQ